MSSQRDQATELLGAYMLKGWTMAAESCPQPSCPGFPLMTRNGASFCVHCDPLPDAPTPTARPIPAPVASPSLGADDLTETSSATVDEPIATALSSPPTTAPTSPAPRAPQPIDIARRAQSDRASAEIGRLLLQGWTLLADECPNLSCYGVPLVRRPKPRAPARDVPGTAPSDVAANVAKRRFGGRASAPTAVQPPARPDPRKLCVICRQEYLSAADAAAMPPPPPQAPSVTRKRSHDALEATVTALALGPSTAAKGKARAVPAAPAASAVTSSDIVGAAAVSQSLETALRTLAGDLNGQVGAATRTPHSVGELADAIGKCARALKDVQAIL